MDIGLLESLVLGSYGFTALAWGWAWRQVEQIKSNHLAHVEERLKKLEKKADIEG